METAKHSSADRIRIAQVGATAKRWAETKLAPSTGYDQAAAIAELDEIVSDADPEQVPHLLAHGALRTRDWRSRTVQALLVAAGADKREVEDMAAAAEARMDAIGFPVGTVEQDQG